MPDDAATRAFRTALPKDLVAAAKHASDRKKNQLQVEGWRHSWLSRMSELLLGKG